jgi:hypothetical protein
MKNPRRFSFLVALALVWSIVTVAAQEQAPAPSFKEGDIWQFNVARNNTVASSTEVADGTYELTILQGKVKLSVLDGNQKTELPTAPDGATQELLSLVGKSPQLQDLKFPLSIGQKWAFDYQTRPVGARNDQRRSAEVVVTGMEQVTTPGGTFKVYKVVRSMQWTGGGRFATVNTGTITCLYSPETRSMVKRSSENSNNPGTVTMELIKFTPGS